MASNQRTIEILMEFKGKTSNIDQAIKKINKLSSKINLGPEGSNLNNQFTEIKNNLIAQYNKLLKHINTASSNEDLLNIDFTIKEIEKLEKKFNSFFNKNLSKIIPKSNFMPKIDLSIEDNLKSVQKLKNEFIEVSKAINSVNSASKNIKIEKKQLNSNLQNINNDLNLYNKSKNNAIKDKTNIQQQYNQQKLNIKKQQQQAQEYNQVLFELQNEQRLKSLDGIQFLNSSQIRKQLQKEFPDWFKKDGSAAANQKNNINKEIEKRFRNQIGGNFWLDNKLGSMNDFSYEAFQSQSLKNIPTSNQNQYTQIINQKEQDIINATNNINELENKKEILEQKLKTIDSTEISLNYQKQQLTSQKNNITTQLTDTLGKNFGNTENEIDNTIQRISNQNNLENQKNKIKQDINDISQTLSKGTTNIKQGFDDLSNAFQINDRAQMDLSMMADNLMDLFSITSTAYMFKRAIGDAFQAVKDLDAVMTETAVVTDFSVSDMWDKIDEYTDQANKLGATIQGAYETRTLYYQQGLDDVEAAQLSEETIKMARIANMDYATTTDMMTAALRGFNMELNNTSAQRINDVYSELAAVSASDTAEIATSMTKTASIANSAGAEFENISALLTQGLETTREAPENIGTALKTIIARFQEIKKSPNELVDIDGEMVDVNKIDTALKSVGIDLIDQMGTFKDFDDVMLEISDKWDTLSQMEQRYIATTAAGSRQQSRFIAMVGDNERLKELIESAKNSEGAADIQFGKTMESLEAKTNKFTNAYHEMVLSITDSNLVKFFVDFGTIGISVFNDLISVVELLPGAFGSVAASLTTLSALWIGSGIAQQGANFLRNTIGKGLKGDIESLENTKTGQSFTRITGQSYKTNEVTPRNQDLTFTGAKSSKKFIKNLQKTRQQSLKSTGENYNILTSGSTKINKKNTPNPEDFAFSYDDMVKAFNNDNIKNTGRNQSFKNVGQTILDNIYDRVLSSFNESNSEKIQTKGDDNTYKPIFDNFKKQLSKQLSETGMLPSSEEINRMLNNDTDGVAKQLKEQGYDNINFSKVTKKPMSAEEVDKIATKADKAGAAMNKMGIGLQSIGDIAHAAGLDFIATRFYLLSDAVTGASNIVTIFGPKLKKLWTALGAGGPVIAGIAAAAALIGAAFMYQQKKIDEAIERAKEATEEYKSSLEEISTNKSTLQDLNDEFTSLSEGVDKNGKNIGLTADEFERYQEIASQVAEINPEAVIGYDSEGNAILDSNAIEKSLDELDGKKVEVLIEYVETNGEDLFINMEENMKNITKDANLLNGDIFSKSLEEQEKYFSDLGRKNFVTEQTKKIGTTKFSDQATYVGAGNANRLGATLFTQEDYNKSIVNYDKEAEVFKARQEELNKMANLMDQYMSAKGAYTGLTKEEQSALSDSFSYLIDDSGSWAEAQLSAQALINTLQQSQGIKLSEVFEPVEGKSIKSLKDLQDYTQEIKDELSETGDVNQYNKSIQGVIEQYEKLAEEAQAAGQDDLATYYGAQAVELTSYAKDSAKNLKDAYDTLADAYAGSYNINERFSEYDKANVDFYEGLQNTKEVLDEVLDGVDNVGKGSNSFWYAAEQILGEKNLEDLDWDFDKVNSKLKSLSNTFADTESAGTYFFDELINKKDQINKAFGEELVQWDGSTLDFEFENFDTEQFEKLADVLGVSYDTLINMMRAAGQFADIDWTNEKLMEGLFAQADNTFTTKKNGEVSSIYMTEDTFTGQLGISGKEGYEAKQDVINDPKSKIELLDWNDKNTFQGFLSEAIGTDGKMSTEEMTKVADQMVKIGGNYEQATKVLQDSGLLGDDTSDWETAFEIAESGEMGGIVSTIGEGNAHLATIAGLVAAIAEQEGVKVSNEEVESKGLLTTGQEMWKNPQSTDSSQYQNNKAIIENKDLYEKEIVDQAIVGNRVADIQNSNMSDMSKILTLYNSKTNASASQQRYYENAITKGFTDEEKTQYQTIQKLSQGTDSKTVSNYVSSMDKLEKEGTITSEQRVGIDYYIASQEDPEQKEALMDYLANSQMDPEQKQALMDYLVNSQDTPEDKDAFVDYLLNKYPTGKDLSIKDAYADYKGNITNKEEISSISGIATFTAKVTGVAGAIQSAVSSFLGSGAIGTSNRRKPTQSFKSFAKGGKIGPNGNGGPTLTGELGPELVWIPSKSTSFIAGGLGPEMINLPSEAVVYPHDETKRIFNGKNSVNNYSGSAAGGANYSGSYPYKKNNGSSSGSSGSPSSKSSGSSSSRSSGSSSKSSKSSDKWKNPYPWIYNWEQKLNGVLQERNKIEEEYDILLAKRSRTGSQIVSNLKEQMNILNQQLKTSKSALSAFISRAKSLDNGYGKYFKYNSSNNTITINRTNLNKVKDEKLGKKIEDKLSELEEMRDAIEEQKSLQREITLTLEEIKQDAREQEEDLYDKVLDVYVEKQQKQIDALQTVNDSINEANSELLDSLNSNLERIRRERENERTEEDIADMQARLNYLRLNTSSGNSVEIKQLEEEIKNAQEDYTDSLIDQSLSNLQEQQDEASKQREKQIDILQKQLDEAQEGGKLWSTIYSIVKSGIDLKGNLIKGSTLEQLIKGGSDYVSGNKLIQNEILNELADMIAGYRLNNPVSTSSSSSSNKTSSSSSSKKISTSSKSKISSISRQLAYGSTGNDVKTLQNALKQLGYNPGSIDGIFGKNTKSAIQKFQRASGITANGIVDKNTKAKFKAKGYKIGGLADYTGLAWLDGTIQKPEMVLNQEDTKNFIALKNLLSKAMSTNTKSIDTKSGDVNYDIYINVEKISKDYDVDKLYKQLEQKIVSNSKYRNVNKVRNFK